MATITSRPPRDVRIGDTVITPVAFDGSHTGQVLTPPEVGPEGLTVRVLLDCHRCGLEHSVSMEIARVVTVQRP